MKQAQPRRRTSSATSLQQGSKSLSENAAKDKKDKDNVEVGCCMTHRFSSQTTLDRLRPQRVRPEAKLEPVASGELAFVAGLHRFFLGNVQTPTSCRDPWPLAPQDAFASKAVTIGRRQPCMHRNATNETDDTVCHTRGDTTLTHI